MDFAVHRSNTSRLSICWALAWALALGSTGLARAADEGALEARAGCQAKAVEVDAVELAGQELQPKTALRNETRGDGVAKSSRNRPRWHSFLPGMFR